MSAVLPESSTRELDRLSRVKLTEIFLSVQGEANTVGWPTVFVRLTGCPLRCQYCDTQYAFYGGEWHNIEDVVGRVLGYGVQHVCVTGGEPLAQKAVQPLMTQLCDRGLSVSLETSGALDISQVDSRVSRVLDLKTPASGEVERNRWDNLQYLRRDEQIKIVICGRKDYEWARDAVRTKNLDSICTVLFSPSFGQVDPRELVDWILADRLPVRFQLQLHKILWGDTPGR